MIVLVAIAAGVLGAGMAWIIARYLPKLKFKSDTPLASYSGPWVRVMPLVAFALILASAALVLSQDMSPLWMIPLTPFAAILGVFTMTDLKHHRLPNGVMALLYGAMLITLPIPAIALDEWDALSRAGIGFGAAVLVFIILAMTGMGGGDLKLIPAAFSVLSSLSWEIAFGWILISWVCAGIWALGQGIVQKSFKGRMPMVPGFTLGFLLLTPFLSLEPFAVFMM